MFGIHSSACCMFDKLRFSCISCRHQDTNETLWTACYRSCILGQIYLSSFFVFYSIQWKSRYNDSWRFSFIRLLSGLLTILMYGLSPRHVSHNSGNSLYETNRDSMGNMYRYMSQMCTYGVFPPLSIINICW